MKKLGAFFATICIGAGVLVACSHGGRYCAGAEELTSVVFVEKGGGGTGGFSSGGGAKGGAPSNPGVRSAPSPASKSPSPAPAPAGNKGGAPTNAGVKAGANSGVKGGAPAYNGTRGGQIPTGAPLPGGRVPSYTGPTKLSSVRSGGSTYIIVNNHNYYSHPHSWYFGRPIDPFDATDWRNTTNPLSPFYGRHISYAC